MKINSEVSEAVEEYLEKPSKEKLTNFLMKYKKMLQDYLDGRLDELELADTSNYVFAIKKEFLKNIPDEVLKLADIVDITHPNWTIQTKRKFVLNIQRLIEGLLKNVNRLYQKSWRTIGR